MPELSAPNAALWRSHDYNMEALIYVHRPTVVLDAQVAMPGGISYPLISIFFDNVTYGSWTNVKPGYLVVFGTAPGLDDLGRTRVKTISSSLLTIPRASRGIHDGEANLSDNVYLRVYAQRRPMVKQPFITDDGQMFKDSNEPLGDHGTMPQPVSNAGPYAIHLADPITNTYSFPFSSDAVWASVPVAPGATITSHAWNFVDGTPSSATTAFVSSVEFPVGAREIEHTVTDSNGKNHTAYAMVVVLPADGTGLIQKYSISPRTKKEAENTLVVRIDEELDPAQYPDGFLVIEFWRQWINGQEVELAGPSGRENIRFVGWHWNDSTKIAAVPRGSRGSVTYTCLDVAGWLGKMPGFPQRLDRATTPADWTQRKEADIDDYFQYILAYHSTALEIAEYKPSGVGSTYPFPGLDSSGSKLLPQVDNRAEAIAYKLTCDYWGRLAILPDPLLQDTADRTPVNIVSMTEVDWGNDGISYTHERQPKSYWGNESAVVATAVDAANVTKIGSVFAIAPGVAPNEGGESYDKGEQLVVDQDELDRRAGHRNARGNATESLFRFKPFWLAFAGVDPAFMEFVRLTVSADYAAQRKLTFTDERFLAREVSWGYNHKDRTITDLVWMLEKQTVGFPATVVIPKESSDLPSYDNPYDYLPLDNLITETPSQLGKGVGRIALPCTDGYFYRTVNAAQDFETPSTAGGPLWDRISMGVSGTPVACLANPYCPKYLNGTGTVDVFVVTTSGIYKVVDVFGTPVATLQKTFRTAGITRRSIQASFDGNTNLLVTSAYTDGVYATWTTDGATWATEELKGSSSVIAGDIAYPATHVSSKSNGLVYLSAYVNSTTADGYKSLDHGDTATALGTPDIIPSERLAGDIHSPFGATDNTVFHGKKSTATASYQMNTANISHWSTVGGTPDFTNGYLNSLGSYYGEVIFYIDGAHSLFTVSQVTWEAFVNGSGVFGQANSHISFEDASNTVLYWVDHMINYTNFTTGGSQGVANWTGSFANVHHIRFKVFQSYGPQWYLTNIQVGTSLVDNALVKVVGSTKTNVSPEQGYAPLRNRQVDSDATDQRYMVACLENADASYSGVWASTDGGGSFPVQLVAPTNAASRPRHAAISSDGHKVIYALGTAGYVGCCTDYATMDDRSGNIPADFPSVGEFLNIIGG